MARRARGNTDGVGSVGNRVTDVVLGRSGWISVTEARAKGICWWCGDPAGVPEFDLIRTGVPSCGCAEKRYLELAERIRHGQGS